MSLSDSKFPSSKAFDLIADGLKDPAEKKQAMTAGKAIFSFQLKNKEGEEKSWYIDLKKKGEVGVGAAPAGEKANVTMIMTDDDFTGLVNGSANAQKLFMGGKLKVKGDVMKATKMETILKKAQAKTGAKL